MLSLTCDENDRAPEDIPGTTNYSKLLSCMTNFFVSKARRRVVDRKLPNRELTTKYEIESLMY